MPAPSLWGNALGSALLAAIERQFPAARRFELFTGSRSEGNIRRYLRHGYEIAKASTVRRPEQVLVVRAKVLAWQ